MAGAQAASARIVGAYVGPGVVCPLLKTVDGRTIALVGLPHALRKPGQRLVLDGAHLTNSQCQQGDGTFRVDRVVSP
jgi:hypothetical protein